MQVKARMGDGGGGGEVRTSPAPTVENGALQNLTYLDENGQLVSIDMQHWPLSYERHTITCYNFGMVNIMFSQTAVLI